MTEQLGSINEQSQSDWSRLFGMVLEDVRQHYSDALQDQPAGAQRLLLTGSDLPPADPSGSRRAEITYHPGESLPEATVYFGTPAEHQVFTFFPQAGIYSVSRRWGGDVPLTRDKSPEIAEDYATIMLYAVQWITPLRPPQAVHVDNVYNRADTSRVVANTSRWLHGWITKRHKV